QVCLEMVAATSPARRPSAGAVPGRCGACLAVRTPPAALPCPLLSGRTVWFALGEEQPRRAAPTVCQVAPPWPSLVSAARLCRPINRPARFFPPLQGLFQHSVGSPDTSSLLGEACLCLIFVCSAPAMLRGAM